MTTNPTIDGVPRELLEAFAAYVADSPNAIMRARAKELRALLDAPVYPQVKMVKPHKHTCACVTGDSGVCDCGAVVDGLPVPAAQPQGEPVAKNKPVAKLHAERLTGRDGEYGVTVEDSQWFNTCRLTGGIFNLYAEQPAPVAAVPNGFMLVERGIWTEDQVESAAKCITMLKAVPGMTDRDLAMAAMDAGQCKAPEITLADFSCLDELKRLNPSL